MSNIIKTRETSESKLERWLGIEQFENIRNAMKDFYHPIAVANVPGAVFAHKGGFYGEIKGGNFASLHDKQSESSKRRSNHTAKNLYAGFASLSDLIAEATVGGKRREWYFFKEGTTGVVNATNSLWRVGRQPSAGAAASAAPGGIAPTDATAGGFPFANPTGGDTLHFITGHAFESIINNTLLLYDRIFAVAKTMSSTGTEAVTGVPSRYQSVTTGAADSAEGNFLFIETGTALGATAHNWTVCTYKDQADAASTLPSLTGNASNIVNRIDHPTGQWFAPLEAGDTGIKALTQMQCSASVTGAVDFVIGHPIAWMPLPLLNIDNIVDGINNAFNFARIFDDACLAFLEVLKPSTSANMYTGSILCIAG